MIGSYPRRPIETGEVIEEEIEDSGGGEGHGVLLHGLHLVARERTSL